MTQLEILGTGIGHYEGFYVAEEEAAARGIAWPTVAQRCNNPMNLKWAGQLFAKPEGIAGHDGAVRLYAHFDTVEHGWDAGYDQIRRDVLRNPEITLWQLIQQWAPAADENDPTAYFHFVAARLDLGPGALVSSLLCEDYAK